jgi:Na+-driven multidrug efflux pump
MQQTEWTPPPAPVSEWQNQNLGANQPFQPSGASVGQNQTLAIVSLVCGVLSIICCFSFITGPAGLITGFMAKNKADQDPAQFGGRGLALAGMITGGIGTLIGILVIILQILGAFAGRF